MEEKVGVGRSGEEGVRERVGGEREREREREREHLRCTCTSSNLNWKAQHDHPRKYYPIYLPFLHQPELAYVSNG